MATTSTPQPSELAAPLDLLLTSATKPFARRMLPDQAWARMAVSLAKQPRTLLERGKELAGELGEIATGDSDRAPQRADKRFSDAAWQQNPLLHRIMQGYLAASDTAEKLFSDADLDWRDEARMRFVFDNAIEGLAPTNNP